MFLGRQKQAEREHFDCKEGRCRELFPGLMGNLQGIGASDNLTVAVLEMEHTEGAHLRASEPTGRRAVWQRQTGHRSGAGSGTVKGRKEYLWTVV